MTFVRLAGAVAACVAGGLAFRRVFPAGDVVPLVVAAAVLAGLLVAVAHRRTGRAAVEAVVSVGGLALFLAAAVFQGVPSPADLRVAVVDGWARILSSTLPVAPEPELLTVPVVATWAAASLAAAASLRRRSAALPLLPPALVLLGGLLLGVGGAGSAASVTAPFLAASAVVLVAGSPAGRHDDVELPVEDSGVERRIRRGRLVSAAAVCVLAAVAAPVVADADPLTADRTPFDPREERRDPVVDVPALNPLASMRRQVAGEPRDLFRVTASAPQFWRLAVLDTYDGLQWSSSADFRPAGPELPVDEGAVGRPAERLEQRFEVQHLAGPWLPAAYRPVAVRGAPHRFDPRSATLVASAELAEPSYTVVSEVPAELTVAERRDARAATGAEVADYTVSPPGGFGELARVAQEATADAVVPFERLEALRAFLKEGGFVFTDEAAAGQSLTQLESFATTRQGTTEQFVSAYALMARSLGFPSRIAVGYRPGTEVAGGAGGTGGTTWQVTTRDLTAWVEVRLQGLGWVDIHPVPPPSDRPPTPEEEQLLQEEQTPVSSPPPPTPEGDAGDGGLGAAAADDDAGLRGWQVAVLLAAGVVVLVVGTGGLVAGLKRRRRSRRRAAGSPRQRAAGAWDQAVEALRSAGVRGEDWMDARDVVRAASATVAAAEGATLDRLREAVNVARFGPAPDEDDAREAWEQVDHLEHALRERAGLLQRTRAAVDPRPLLRR